MFQWEVEWAIIRAAKPELESWLFSDEIYWPLSFDRSIQLPSQRIPRLSAGRLLLSLKLLQGFMYHKPEIREKAQEDYDLIDALIERWYSNWQKKKAAKSLADYANGSKFCKTSATSRDSHNRILQKIFA